MAVTAASQKIEVITGPTASGKTALALSRAADDPTIEIVNADAFQIYRGFDIGTGKSSPEERKAVLHHLVDILDPQEAYSAGQYAKDARAVIINILGRGHRPIVVGGTGLYIDALFFGISSVDIDEDAKQEATSRYAEELAEHGFDNLHERLREIDPTLYEQIARERNPLRLERAWVHYYATGVPLGEARKERKDVFQHVPEFTVLMPDRDKLRMRIEERIDTMLAAGWAEEVRTLLIRGVTTEMPAMRAIGYRELSNVVAGSMLLSEAKELIIIQTRQYAKRQMTWMKRYQREDH